jgi:hypothetical protein
MGSAAGFLWMAVVILALAWALQLSGTVNTGFNLGIWLPVLLVLALAGAVFNMFVMPFLGRTRTARTSVSAAGTTAPAAVPPVVPTAGVPAQPAVIPPTGATPSGVPAANTTAQQEVVQETRDQPTL